jgi:hypothetical protein
MHASRPPQLQHTQRQPHGLFHGLFAQSVTQPLSPQPPPPMPPPLPSSLTHVCCLQHTLQQPARPHGRESPVALRAAVSSILTSILTTVESSAHRTAAYVQSSDGTRADANRIPTATLPGERLDCSVLVAPTSLDFKLHSAWLPPSLPAPAEGCL